MKVSRIKAGTKFKVTVDGNSRDSQIGTGKGEVIFKEGNVIAAKMEGSEYRRVNFTLTCEAYHFKILKY